MYDERMATAYTSLSLSPSSIAGDAIDKYMCLYLRLGLRWIQRDIYVSSIDLFYIVNDTINQLVIGVAITIANIP